MSLRFFKITMGILGGIMVMFAIAIAVIGLRGESTRNIVERSACANDPSGRECQSIKRNADRERSVRDSCIPFKQVLTARAYRALTRCPRREVVPHTSETASQPSGRGPNAPGVPDDPPVTDRPDSPPPTFSGRST